MTSSLMQQISINGNRPLALYIGQFLLACDQRRLGTERNSARPGKNGKKVPHQRENPHAWCEKVLKIGP